MGLAYYNEHDEVAAAVLRRLIAEEVIAFGDVDTRSITDVRPGDLSGYAQCHFFAGGGLWSVAARMAGWPDDRPLWTGSCPCQPFSAAGKGGGVDDPRHLWPDFFRLIRECRPPVVFGEQVSTAAGKRTPVDEDMHGLWRAEDLSGFLPHEGFARQFDWLSLEMQALLPRLSGEISEWLEGAEVGFFQEVPGGQPRFGAGLGRALQGEAGRVAVRSRPMGAAVAGEDRGGSLRTLGPPVSAGWRADLGQPFTRPDYAGTWLHNHERAGRPVRAECDDEHLGRGAGAEGGEFDPEGTRGGRQQSPWPVGGSPEGALSLDWLDGVRFDLDAIGYSVGHPDIPACAVDAPHIRQRLYWIAVGDAQGGSRAGARRSEAHHRTPRGGEHRGPDAGGLVGDALGPRLEGQPRHVANGHRPGWVEQDAAGSVAPADGSGLDVADADAGRRSRRPEDPQRGALGRDADERPVARNGSFWSDAEWLACHDGKARRTQPGLRLLVDGLPGRVGLWRIAGNAIVAPLAAEVIRAFMDVEP